ncbi:MAG: hypothetical protein Q9225_007751 [Loekoesia sp. 1 TL-2023]
MSLRRYYDEDFVITNIDRRECRRIVPMRVLALGLSRTGTDSLRSALRTLGFHDVYHGWSVILENPADGSMWYEALRAKYDGVGKPYGRPEFDKLLGHCQAVTDIPAATFAEELIKAYPEAKVVLTDRNVDSWYDSILQTLYPYNVGLLASFHLWINWVFRTRARWVRPMFAKIWHETYKGDFIKHGKSAFREHYAKIRELVPEDRLLIYHVSDGWGPLCKFLDVPKPEQPFPKGNDLDVFYKRFQADSWYTGKEIGLKLLLCVALLLSPIQQSNLFNTLMIDNGNRAKWDRTLVGLTLSSRLLETSSHRA